MNTSYSKIFIILCLSRITCSNINIAKVLPAYGSNTDTMVSEIVKIISAVESNHLGKSMYIKTILPSALEKSMMSELMDRTAQKIGANWLVSTNDTFCCDSYETIFAPPLKPMIVENKPDVYIIPLRKHGGVKYLDAQLNIMRDENSFNPRAIFMLISLTRKCGDYKDNKLTNLYFDEMWKQNCMSSLILVLSECDFKTTITTATPFSDSNMCRKVHENGTKQFKSKWSERELIGMSIYKTQHRNFNKCTFSVGTTPSPPHVVASARLLGTNASKIHYEFVGGIDLELLNVGSALYNFTYVFDVKHGFDSDAMIKWLPNGTFSGIFIDLFYRQLDITVGGIMPHQYNYYKYDYSDFYKLSYLGWAVNDASLAPQWKIFFGAFSQEVWIIFGFVFIITSALYSFLDRFVNTCFVGNHHKSCATYLCSYPNFQTMPLIQYFSTTLGMSSTIKPKSPSLRIWYFSWNIYSLHMSIAYLSMLFFFISNPPLENEITTVEDLQNAGLKVGSLPVVFRRLAGSDLDGITQNILENQVVCFDWESCIENLIKHRNGSVLIQQDLLEYYVNTKRSKVHTISFSSYGASVMTSKGNPLYPALDKLAGLAFEAGLVDKWKRDTKSKFKSENNINAEFKGSEKISAILKISDLKFTFSVLVSGIVLSSLLFLGELMISCLHK